MNAHRSLPEEAVADRHLDLMLAERLKGDVAPDLTERIRVELARHEEPRTPFVAPAKRRLPARAGFGLAAALLALTVVIAVGYGNRSTPADTAPGHGGFGARAVLPQGEALGPAVTVATLAEIAALPADADNVRLRLHTADAVRALARLRGLRRLDAAFDLEVSFDSRSAERPNFFPAAAEPMGQLTSLEELDISGHGPIRGLAPLETLSRLRRLRIYYALMEVESLGVLAKLPRLEHLTLEATLSLSADEPLLDLRHPEFGLTAFAGTGRLRTLTLTACIADLAGMRSIAGNPLEQLRIYGVSREQPGEHRRALEAAAYVPLGGIRSLRVLEFSDSCSLELFAGLEQCPHLTKLNLGGADAISGREAGRAIARLPHLRSVNVEGSFIDHEALIGLTESQTIEELGLGGDAECTDAILARVAKMPALRRLTMPLSHPMTDAGMAVLSSTQLEHFGLPYPEKITAAGLLHLPRTVRSITGQTEPFDAAVFARLDKLSEATFFGYYEHDLPVLEGLLASPARTGLRCLTLSVPLVRLSGLSRLRELSGLQVLDATNSVGELPDTLVGALRQRGVKVLLPKVREDAPMQVFGEVEVVEEGGKKK